MSAEYSPFAKTGGLGDVAAALTCHLARRGHDLRVFVPLHGQMELTGVDRHPVDFLRGLTLQVGPYEFHYDVQTARVPDTDLWVYLVDCPALFDRPRVYSDAPDEHVRYLALTRAAFECCQRMNVRAAGRARERLAYGARTTAAQAGLRLGRDIFGGTRSVFTIHNIGYQGVFSAGRAVDLGPGVGIEALHQPDLGAGRVNPMRLGVIHADAVTTVSPTYAMEICTPEGGHGLDGDLRARDEPVTGILNGVDYDEWNPAGRSIHSPRYDATDLTGKLWNKLALLDLLRMPAAPDTPLVGMVTGSRTQKGLDLLVDVLPELLASRDLRFVALGSGEHRYEEFLHGLQERFPGRATFYSGYSEELAHMIEAASDIFLMPSLYEPCGLNQMYSLKYGTVPVVRRTGGLADSVQHFDPATGQGTGVVFNDFDVPAVRWALETALDWYGQPTLWRRLVLNGMRQDFSWDRQARRVRAPLRTHRMGTFSVTVGILRFRGHGLARPNFGEKENVPYVLVLRRLREIDQALVVERDRAQQALVQVQLAARSRIRRSRACGRPCGSRGDPKPLTKLVVMYMSNSASPMRRKHEGVVGRAFPEPVAHQERSELDALRPAPRCRSGSGP